MAETCEPIKDACGARTDAALVGGDIGKYPRSIGVHLDVSVEDTDSAGIVGLRSSRR